MDNQGILDGVKKIVTDLGITESKAFHIIPVIISAKNQVVKIDTQSKLEHKKIIGVFGVSTSDFGIVKSTLSLTIDEKEVFPDGFDVTLINHQNGVSVNDTPYRIERRGLNSTIRGTYTDGGNINTQYPYKFNLYLLATK